jgi:RNA polymerase sigma-70 factor (ECF subfamily)
MTLDDTACLVHIQHGGRAAQRGVALLYQRYAPRFLWHFTHHYGFAPEEAEDIVQDAFVNLVRTRGTGREVTAVAAWLWRIAINCANDAYRRKRSPSGTLMSDEATDERKNRPMDHARAASHVTDNTPEPDLVDCVRQAFRAFATDHPQRAQALSLVILEGWTAKELATYLGRSHGATREYVSRCRALLRPYLLERCGDYLLSS